MSASTRGSAAVPDWHADGLCAQVDPELFFPDKGNAAALAKRICTACLVRLACLEYAVEHGERGIWGGTSYEQRKAIRRVRDGRDGRAAA